MESLDKTAVLIERLSGKNSSTPETYYCTSMETLLTETPANIPPVPGLYLVILQNDRPLPIDRDRRRIQKCLRVTKDNCKIGRASNLLTRSRCYHRIFGQYAHFIPVAAVEEIEEAEAAILSQLKSYRIMHRGRYLEWLAGIGASDVIAISLETLNQLTYPHYNLFNNKPSNDFEVLSQNLGRMRVDSNCLSKEFTAKILDAIRQVLSTTADRDCPCHSADLLKLWQQLGSEYAQLFPMIHQFGHSLTGHLKYCQRLASRSNRFLGAENIRTCRRIKHVLTLFSESLESPSPEIFRGYIGKTIQLL